MSKKMKILLFAIGGFVGLVLLAAMALRIFLDADVYKPRLEAAASKALGMEVRIGGQVRIGLFPKLFVTLKDVRVRNLEAEVASASEARLGIDLFPLFRKKVRIGKIAIKHPRMTVRRDGSGRFNVERPETHGGTLPVLYLAKAVLSDGSLIYSDEISGQGFEAVDCGLDVRRLRLADAKNPDRMTSLSFTANLACRQVRSKNLTVSDLRIMAKGENGIFGLDPVTMTVFGGEGTGVIQADFTGAVPRCSLRYSLPQFRIEEFFKTLSPVKVAEGAMDFSANLSTQGRTLGGMKQTMDGEITLRGKNLTLIGHDLDQELSRFESSQNFNLVDVGAFFFAGPVGLMVTKGYNFASIFQGAGGRSEIQTLVSDWKVVDGVAQARDVAMATKKNRVALRGDLDFVNQRFVDVTVAVIDAHGCATVRQKITGSFREPVVEKPNILKSLAGPVLKLLQMGRDLFPGGECEVFYAGSVAP